MGLIPEGESQQQEEKPAEGAQQEQKPAEGAQQEQVAGERPAYIPETLWKDGAFDTEGFEKYRPPAADVPADPTGYQIPTIEGLDAEKFGESPLAKALMKGAHANGLGQEAFEGVLKDYVEGEQARVTAFEEGETAKLGENGQARLKALGSWLDSSLPAEQAGALRSALTTAEGVAGLEALMNKGVTAAPRDNPPPAAPTKTKEQIEALMRTPAYRGRETERDPAVIKEVDDWFAANAKPKAKV